jgi:tetratricopeptide (TPR) repeat protein
MKKKFTVIQNSDFPDIEPDKFQEWEKERAIYIRNGRLISGILSIIILLIFLGIWVKYLQYQYGLEEFKNIKATIGYSLIFLMSGPIIAFSMGFRWGYKLGNNKYFQLSQQLGITEEMVLCVANRDIKKDNDLVSSIKKSGFKDISHTDIPSIELDEFLEWKDEAASIPLKRSLIFIMVSLLIFVSFWVLFITLEFGTKSIVLAFVFSIFPVVLLGLIAIGFADLKFIRLSRQLGITAEKVEGIIDKTNSKRKIDVFNKELKNNPRDTEKYLLRAVLRKQLDDKSGAMADYNLYIESNVDDANGYWYRGDLKYEVGDYIGALADFEKTLKIDFKKWDDKVLKQRGMTKYKLGDYKAAIMDFNRSLENDPKEADVLFFRAKAKKELGDIKGAKEDYNKIIIMKAEIDDKKLFYYKAKTKTELGDLTDALKYFNKVINLDPNDENAYFERGEVSYKLHDYSEAVDDFTKTIEINPDYAKAYYYRGMAQIELNRKDIGCLDLRKAEEIESNALNSIKK